MKIQILRAISILTAVIVATWLPLRLVGIAMPVAVNMTFDVLVSIVSCINVYLNFKKRGVSYFELRNWADFSIFMDLVSFIPIYTIGFQITGLEIPWLKFNNLLAARHVWKIKDFLDEFTLPPILYRLIPIGLMMPLLVHLISCGWIALGSGSAGPNADKTFEYVKAFYWAMTTLTTVGYGDIVPQTILQICYAVFTQITGVAVFGFVLSNVASMLSRADAAREHHMDNVDRIETFMRSNKIPTQIRNSVRSYFKYLWDTHRGYQDRTIIKNLPQKVQSELILYISRHIIEKVPFLKSASPELLEDIMHCLEPCIFVPDERIFHVNEEGDALYLIHHGSVDIINQDGTVLVTLSEGAFFGERALVSNSPRSATAIAKSYSDIYKLKKSNFKKVVASYPEFQKHVYDLVESRKVA